MNHWPTILLAALLLVPAWRQAPPQQTATASVALPNPYRTIDRWGTLPAGRTWGGVTAVDIDRDGRSITAAEAVAVDAAGTVYGAVVPAQMLQKHVRQ